jgi:glycerate-2-kinase
MDPGSAAHRSALRRVRGTGDLVLTGPTLTNVNDVRVILVDGG